MYIQSQDHLESLIGSLNKLFLDAKNKGIIRNKELSLLNLIYKLLTYNCFSDLAHNDEKKLVSLYYKLLNKYRFLCKANIIRDNYINTNNATNQTHINTNTNTAPEIEDPVDIEPEPPMPVICKAEIYYNRNLFESLEISHETFLNCYEDENDSPYLYFKLVMAPTGGIIETNDGTILEEGSVIDLTQIEYMKYYNFSMTTDELEFAISNSQGIYSLPASLGIVTI